MAKRPLSRRIPVLTRRHFLRLSATGLTGAFIVACGASPATPASEGQPSAAAQASASAASTAAPAVSEAAVASAAAPAASQAPAASAAASGAYNEAPVLADLVQQGKLPAVAERLPLDPLVVEPVERVGKYGGTVRAAILGPADGVMLNRTIGYEHLVRWSPDWEQVLPNVAESFEASPDFTTYTFKLREGHKWSDGEPFTADDILFWWEDIVNNEELSSGGVPGWMKSGGKAGQVEVVDPLTVRFSFEFPNGLFLNTLANVNTGGEPTRYPKHYLAQFHQKYNTTNLDQLVSEAQAENWVNLFQLKGSGVPGTPSDARWQNLELPTLHGWLLTAPLGADTLVTAERNPYYFKVDPENNQLPYIDRFTYDVIGEAETLILKVLSGEHDIHHPFVALPANKAVFAEGLEASGYRFFETVPAGANECAIALNMTHKDPIKREVFANRDFRAGLSHAINRQEIIDVVFIGDGEPWQVAPRREAPWYNEQLATQYLAYDVQKANEFLDKVLPDKDGEGFRLGPDGKRFSFQIEVVGTQQWRIDTLNLVQTYWKDVGVDMQVAAVEAALLNTRRESNDHDGIIAAGQGGLRNALTEMPWYVPFNQFSAFAIPWALWFNPVGTPRAEPEEPPEAIRQQMDLYREIAATGEADKQTELMNQLLEIAAEQFYGIGILVPGNGYGVARTSLRNIPETMFDGGGSYTYPVPTNVAQYFFE